MEQQIKMMHEHPKTIEPTIFGWLEALLFAAGDTVETATLAKIVGLSVEDTHDYLTKLQKTYQDDSRGLCLIEVNDTWQLSTKPAFFELIKALYPYEREMHLSRAALETLAIIAYRQPVTRVDVEQIRGVASSSPIKSLLDHDLIVEAGRKDAPGRPFFYKTTDDFLKAAGLRNLSELPPIDSFDEKQEASS